MADLDCAINALLKQWKTKRSYKAFIADGIVSEEEYAKPHVLFVLREKNDPNPGDLREQLRTYGCVGKTWNNVARWTKALLDREEIYPKEIDRIPWLRKTAAINIKKEGGGSRAKWNEITDAAAEDREEIRQEITLCDPDIIIGCGLGNAVLLKEYVFGNSASDWKDDLTSLSFQRKWQYYTVQINGKTVPVIDFCHPQVTNLEGRRGHAHLFEPLYRDMLHIKDFFSI